jgi:hypothetical protein
LPSQLNEKNENEKSEKSKKAILTHSGGPQKSETTFVHTQSQKL